MTLQCRFLTLFYTLERENMGFIYKITNQINQKVYIGMTYRTPQIRFKEHLKDAEEKNYNRPLYNAINKYGKENFSISIIEEVENNELLGEREKYWINFLIVISIVKPQMDIIPLSEEKDH